MIEDLKTIYKECRVGKTGRLRLMIDGREYTRLFRPGERLILLGAGHIARTLCSLASVVEFQTVVLDDREEFADKAYFPQAKEVICQDFGEGIKHLQIGSGDYIAIVTRGHRFDAECIRSIFASGTPKYVGLLGSRKRTGMLKDQLAEEGISREWLDEIHTPIGLDIGALTVEEIAFSIVAEMIRCRRQDVKMKTKSGILAEETFHENVLEYIVTSEKKQTLILVYETDGPSPVKSGCLMTVDEDHVPHGTIGGGLAENIAVKEAVKIVGTGTEKTLFINLAADTADKEGMVCGGAMKVYLKDL